MPGSRLARLNTQSVVSNWDFLIRADHFETGRAVLEACSWQDRLLWSNILEQNYR